MLHKRLDYGLNGYQVPPTPRAPRSARRRGPISRKKVEDSLCPFDLLASVAGKILLEGETPPAGTAALSRKDENQRMGSQENGTVEPNEGPQSMEFKNGDDPVNSGNSLPVQEVIIPVDDQQCDVTVDAEGGTCSGVASGVTNSGSGGSLRIHFQDKMVLDSDKSEIGCHSSKLSDNDKGSSDCHSSKLGEGYTSGCRGGSCVIPKLENPVKPLMSTRPVNTDTVSFGTGPDICGSEDPKLASENKPPTLGSSCGNGKLAPFCKENCSGVPVSVSRDNVKLVSRDDDENSCECSRPSMKVKKSRTVSHIGNRKIRKLLASRYWRAAPRIKDGDLSDDGVEFHSVYHNRNNIYKRQRSQRIYPLKKRKIFHYVSNPDHGTNCDGIYKSAEKDLDMTAPDHIGAIWHEAIGKDPFVADQNSTSKKARESNVKLRIKSFRVPELFIELPETATVGSLKKTVLDAVTALLGGGLRVGVLLQGKKVRDDGKTLLQSGISHDDEAGSVGFSLEPNSSQTLQPIQPDSSEDRGPVVSSNELWPMLGCPPASTGVHQGTSHASSDYQVSSLAHHLVESDHDSAPSPAETSVEKSGVDSRALVALPEGNAEALTVIPPMNQRCRRSDMAQRRIRRPFSVGEVEALVQAVEKLGTGRWRDVKLRAFDNMKHRTYVDLKDKWKTLVHTARISPQQRRGEPVPQELLDRVLVAHAYWSQQQAKHQQVKQQPGIPCLLA